MASATQDPIDPLGARAPGITQMGHPAPGGQPHLPPLHGFKSTAAPRNAGKAWAMGGCQGTFATASSAVRLSFPVDWAPKSWLRCEN